MRASFCGSDITSGMDLDIGEGYAELLGPLVDFFAGKVFHPIDDEVVYLVRVGLPMRSSSHSRPGGRFRLARPSPRGRRGIVDMDPTVLAGEKGEG